MKFSNFIFLSFIFACLFSNTAKASDSIQFRRTDIYVLASLGDYCALSLNADHYFFNTKKIHLGITSGICNYGTFAGISGYQVPLAVTGLLGKNHHFLELQGGALFRSQEIKDDQANYENSVLGFAALGYAFRSKHFLFKANASTTRVIQAGCGYIF